MQDKVKNGVGKRKENFQEVKEFCLSKYATR